MIAVAAAEQLRAPELYGRLLATAAAAALDGGGPPQARIRLADGRLQAMPLDLWLGPVTAADRMVVDAARGPVLDVGCGPGRLLEALEAEGKRALGVDLSPEAVGLARRRGGRAIAGCVFSDLPGDARWRTVLLLDGNIGIGGHPVQLLRRVAALLRADGVAIVEVAPPGFPTRRTRVRIEGPGVVSDWFSWAEVSADGIGAVAAAGGLRLTGRLERDGRAFAMLRRMP
jgi:SAM-dependent methyltransferase